ncbi:unnamed protein product [Leptosia nina]|uniref:Uncharacterized protein n=1 Tax=Leptosia nina TaxID=320188 RepID=A0AAV1JIQ3_9NEOP
MGTLNSKEMVARRKIDTATSNSSLSNMRYVMASNKSKWKLFRKREITPIPAYTAAASLKPKKGCPCGNDGPCKQKITPRGVTIHYPQKKKKLFGASKAYIPPKTERTKDFTQKLHGDALRRILVKKYHFQCHSSLTKPTSQSEDCTAKEVSYLEIRQDILQVTRPTLGARMYF